MSLLQLTYDEIFSSFLSSVKDHNLSLLEESDANDLMEEWLRKGVSKSYIKRLFFSSTLDTENKLFVFELKHPSLEESDSDQTDFVKEVVCKAMLIEWCEPQVKNSVNLSQFFGSKEQKWFSQAQHLTQLRELLMDTKIELRHELGDRGVLINTYLGTSK